MQAQQIQTNNQTRNIKYIEPKVFNFRRHWKHKVKPYLFDEEVQNALNYGMEEMMENWRLDADLTNKHVKERCTWIKGSPPYYKTSSDYWLHHRKPMDHSVGWYQCVHGCHWICYFCKELGKRIYPNLIWKILKSKRHSVAVGFKDSKPYIIFDILNFEHMSAENILDFANSKITNKLYESKWKSK